MEDPEYRGPVADAEFDGVRMPAAWRAYLQGPSWFHRGWVTEGCFLQLYSPSESRAALDLCVPDPPVLLVDITSEGWDSAIEQAANVADLIARVEARTFAFRW